jgi:predicted enzyme related to lactoylglutathione lyase
MSKNPVVHFEMPYEDKGRAHKFYADAFGWNMVEYGPEMGDYVVAQTAETDEHGMIQQMGAINGGFFPKKADWPDQIPSVVISVEDIVKGMEQVKAAGGEVLGEPIDIPGVGLYVSFRDTEGNRVSLMQAHVAK